LSRYYSKAQQSLRPACIVKPTNSEELSQVIKLAATERYPFAVVSGGHMCWAGSSNIQDGLLLDMSDFTQIDLSTKDQVLQLGPGCTWKDVFAALTPHDLAVAGARINEVGVGGLLLGGILVLYNVTSGWI
jgi:FAD/FMN-containing dehydrogenase